MFTCKESERVAGRASTSYRLHQKASAPFAQWSGGLSAHNDLFSPSRHPGAKCHLHRPLSLIKWGRNPVSTIVENLGVQREREREVLVSSSFSIFPVCQSFPEGAANTKVLKLGAKTKMAGPSRVSESLGLWQGPKICICNKPPAGSGTTHDLSRVDSSLFLFTLHACIEHTGCMSWGLGKK